MKSFKEFGIKTASQAFVGDKIKMEKILNREIIIHDYRIDDSKFEGAKNNKCLVLQIEFKEEKHVVFTGATVLIESIQQVPKKEFPFTATIIKENERYEFS